MKRIIALLAMLPALCLGQAYYAPNNVAITGGTIQGLYLFGTRSSGAFYDLQIGSDEALTASRLLKFNVNDGARTVTVPGSTTVPIASQALTLSGPTAARTITLPDANFTVARTDAGQTFTGTQAFGALTATTATVSGQTLLFGASSSGTQFGTVGTSNALFKSYLGGSMGISLGASGSGYGEVGYNVDFQSASGTYKYLAADTAQSIQFSAGNMLFKGASSGSAGAALTLSTWGTITSTGLNSTAVGSTTRAAGAFTTLAASGNITATRLLVGSTAPTYASGGCSTRSAVNSNGTAAFNIQMTGVCAGSQPIVFTLPAATTSWACQARNITTATIVPRQTGAASTTSVTITAYSITTGAEVAWTANDFVEVSCVGY